MKNNREFELMLELERAINAASNYVRHQTEGARNDEQFAKWYGIETLFRAMTEIKCSISQQMDNI